MVVQFGSCRVDYIAIRTNAPRSAQLDRDPILFLHTDEMNRRILAIDYKQVNGARVRYEKHGYWCAVAALGRDELQTLLLRRFLFGPPKGLSALD